VTGPGRRAHILVALGVVALDQIVKQMVRMGLDYGDTMVVIPNLLNLTRVHNTGAAFGMLNPIDFPFKPLVMMLLPLAALAGLAIYAGTLGPEQRLSRLGLAFVIGGAAGNLIDRIAFGYVLDFVDAYWRGWHFWAFNVADTSINVGVGLMILDLLGIGRHRVSRTL
jgi:signal peptidase II